MAKSIFYKCIGVLFCVLILISLSLNVKKGQGLYLLCGTIGIGLLAWIFSRFFGKRSPVILVVSSGLFLVFLIVATHFYYFETGWDAGTVVWNAKLLADGKTSDLELVYFSIYPNNVTLTILLSWIIKLGRLLPAGTDYYLLIAFQCVAMVISSVLVYKTALLLSLPEAAARLARVLFILLAGLSPWIVIPYSDTMGMFLMILVLYLYAKDCHPLLLGAMVGFGTLVKPTVFIFGIALALTKFPEIFTAERRKGFLKKTVFFLVGLIAAIGVLKAVASLNGFHLDKGRSMSMAHYLMMGLNEEYNGVINPEDQDFSLAIEDPDERVKQNLDVAAKRFSDLWPERFWKLMGRKLNSSLGDGTFFWGKEGQFIFYQIWTGNEKAEALFRDFYYPGAKHYGIFTGFEQCLWLGILLLGALSIFFRDREKRSVLYLMVIGMALFEMIFEPRARHLLLLTPMMCMFAAETAANLMSRVRNLRIGNQESNKG